MRPTQDRVREALFSMLMNEIPGARFLDLFAGTGAVGIEAFSRGAADVTFVERDQRHVAILKKNLSSLGVSPAATHVIKADAFRFPVSSKDVFNIVFADPPYALWNGSEGQTFLAALAETSIVAAGGIFVAEMLTEQDIQLSGTWKFLKSRPYGKTKLSLWLRK